MIGRSVGYPVEVKRHTGPVPAGRLTVGLPSLVLGLLPLLAPRRVVGVTGLPPGSATRGWVRAVGVRETVVALAFLIRPGRRRVVLFPAQDVLDLVALAVAARRPGSDKRRIAATAIGYVALLIIDLGVTRRRWRRS